ncbi:MAG: winged helix-turn-helix domain-containing protein [Candidatus Heimdallarchaeota archaeon]|nr:winged helix-turn-helix domain-containing protein [Candidatus Heimdallarchaeota archaeon]
MDKVDWNIVSFVTSSTIRLKILIELNRNKLTPTNLSNKLHYPISHISSTLKTLENNGLIECLTEKRRKNKFFTISIKGKKILEFINKETSTTSEK